MSRVFNPPSNQPTKLVPTDEQINIVNQAIIGSNIAIQAYAGAAKAQPIWCKVQTPSGEVCIGDLQLDDILLDTEGGVSKVIGIFPQGVKETYKVTFMDGSSTHCNDDHLWNVQYGDSRAKLRHGIRYRTVTFKEIRETGVSRPSGGYRWQIPLTAIVNYPTKDLYIHPYLLGLLLGDGCLVNSSPCLSIGRNEWGIINELQTFLPKGCSFNERLTGDNCKQLTLTYKEEGNKPGCNLLKTELTRLDLLHYSHNKFIPIDYLYGDNQQRLWLLRGLMDSDGSCSSNRTRFSSTSKQLIDDVIRLVNSLGGTAIYQKEQKTDRDNQLYYLNIKMFVNPFYNESKSSKWRFSIKNPPSRFITNIEKVDDSEQVCIKVSASNSLYLTDDFIVTHNTTTLLMVAEEIVKPTLMICFNKSIADEASKKFPSHVTCQTINSLAWRAIVRSSNSKFGKKLGGSFKLDEVDLPYVVTKDNEDKAIEDRLTARDLITNWCNSSYVNMFDYYLTIFKEEDLDKLTYLSNILENFWNKVSNPNDPTTMTHDVYLKLFQLSKPVLPFDLIMLDEFQDTNPVSLDIFLSQSNYDKQLICVGDKWQSIYAFRGAVDSFKLLEEERQDFLNLRLSTSFRFGANIADIANDLLYIGGEDGKLVGGRVDIEGKSPKTTAYLYRNNLNTLGKLLEFAELGHKVNFIGDLKDLWSKAYHVTALLADKSVKFPNKDLSSYRTKKDLLAAANRMVDIKTLLGLVSYINANGGVYNFSKKVTDNVDSDSEITISTIHKSKGLEWDIVYLGDDCYMPKRDATDCDTLLDGQCLELIYIGITRAIREVVLPIEVERILDMKDRLRDDVMQAKSGIGKVWDN